MSNGRDDNSKSADGKAQNLNESQDENVSKRPEDMRADNDAATAPGSPNDSDVVHQQTSEKEVSSAVITAASLEPEQDEGASDNPVDVRRDAENEETADVLVSPADADGASQTWAENIPGPGKSEVSPDPKQDEGTSDIPANGHGDPEALEPTNVLVSPEDTDDASQTSSDELPHLGVLEDTTGTKNTEAVNTTGPSELAAHEPGSEESTDPHDGVQGQPIVIDEASTTVAAPLAPADVHDSADSGPTHPVTDEMAASASAASAVEAIDRCLAEDDSQCAAEHREIEAALVDELWWVEKQDALADTLHRITDVFRTGFEAFDAFDEQLPEQTRSELAGRREGLRLCRRMLDRAIGRVSAIEASPSETVSQSHPLELNELVALLDKDGKNPEEKLQKLLKQRRVQHGSALAEIRQRARRAEKQFTSAIERQILPIVDGLDEGRRFGKVDIDRLICQSAEESLDLSQWFSVYDVLLRGFDQELGTLGLKSRTQEPGEPIDYERYEPLFVEEDPAFEDEQVKETMRRCYVLLDQTGCEELVIRSGQVVVIKNPTSE